MVLKNKQTVLHYFESPLFVVVPLGCSGPEEQVLVDLLIAIRDRTESGELRSLRVEGSGDHRVQENTLTQLCKHFIWWMNLY